MGQQFELAQGWTLSEAAERCSPDLASAWGAAYAAWNRARTPLPSGPVAFFRRSPHEIERLRLEVQHLSDELKANLWSLLIEGKLVGFGSREGPSTPASEIPAPAWKSLGWPKRVHSTLVERVGSRIKLFNVRIFPRTEQSPAGEPPARQPLEEPAVKSSRPATEPKRASPKQESIREAICALWPTGIPKGTLVKTRNKAIINWQKSEGRAVVDEKTIHRYFKALESR